MIKIIAVCFILAVIIKNVVDFFHTSTPAAAAVPAKPETKQQLEARAATKIAEAAKELRWQAILRTGEALRASMRNPPSLVYEGIWANADASVICFSYRSQNGFGGMSKESLVLAHGKASQSSSDWNRNCVKKPLESMDLALWQLNQH